MRLEWHGHCVYIKCNVDELNLETLKGTGLRVKAPNRTNNCFDSIQNDNTINRYLFNVQGYIVLTPFISKNVSRLNQQFVNDLEKGCIYEKQKRVTTERLRPSTTER